MESDWKGQSPAIEEFRDQIDIVDDQILELFNERARLVLRVGEIKRAQNLPIYVPDRESRILERLRDRNRGPLDTDTVTRLYRDIIEKFRCLEDGVG